MDLNQNFERRPGKRNGETVLVDVARGYIWHLNGTTRYRCLRFSTDYCRAGLSLIENNYVETGVHTHDDDFEEINRLEFENWCKSKAMRSALSLQAIYNLAAHRFRHHPVHPEFNSIRRTLHRARGSVQPLIPTSVVHAERLIINSHRYRASKDGNTQFFWGRVHDETGEALVFINIPTLGAFVDALELHMDATFQSAPNGYFQLASLHMIRFGTAINVALFLMTRKSQSLYEAVLNRLLEVCFQQTGRRPSPNLLISDYELAIMRATSNCFPTGRSRGCWFHSGTAMYRRACNLGLTIAYRDIGSVKLIVRMSIALALLPPNLANEGLEAIKTLCRLHDAQFTPQVRVGIAQYLHYVESFWFQRIGPERFCVYTDINRTNNLIESWHRQLNAIVGHAHPSFWQFIDHIQTVGDAAVRNLDSITSGRPVRLPRRRQYQQQDSYISTAIQNLQTNRITISEFLQLAANYFHPIEVNPQINVENEHNDDIDGPFEVVRAIFEALIPPLEMRPADQDPVAVVRGRQAIRRPREDEDEDLPQPARIPRVNQGEFQPQQDQPFQDEVGRLNVGGRAEGVGRGRGRAIRRGRGVGRGHARGVGRGHARGVGRGRARAVGRGRADGIVRGRPRAVGRGRAAVHGQVQGNMINPPLQDDLEYEILIALDDDQPVDPNDDDGLIDNAQQDNLDDPCPVCLSRLPDCGIDCCDHHYCRTCIGRILRNGPRNCPLCRRTFQRLVDIPAIAFEQRQQETEEGIQQQNLIEVEDVRDRVREGDREPELIIPPLQPRIIPGGDRQAIFARIMAMVQENLNNPPPPLEDVMYLPPELDVDDDLGFEILVAQPVEPNLDTEDNNVEVQEISENSCPLCLIRNAECAIDSCNHRFCRVCIGRVSRNEPKNCPTCQRSFQEVLYLLEIEID